MRILILTSFIIFTISFFSCNTAQMSSNEYAHTNELINESSPYLLQHAHNPVDWYPWGEKALEKAKKEDKLLIISIGYAACHWCHVMEHESFEDSTVAKIMNDHFVCVKVDREERPDIDDVYMTACQLASGRGCGWPLNAFALPDGRPVWAGTYFPKEQWMNILNQFKTLKESDPDRLHDAADRITKGIQSFETIEVAEGDVECTIDELAEMGQSFIQEVDMIDGGRRGAPKFPMPTNYEFLLHYHHLSKDANALVAVNTTLTKMANGGIYDQLGGGFARYSVDSFWLVPHFEKMLYDNGQLVSLYSKAYQVTGNPLYKKVVEETIQFVERELMDESGGFYSSLDADSEGEEGKFYVWDAVEIDEILGEKSSAFKSFYSVTEDGNWEHKNILTVNNDYINQSGQTRESLESSLSDSKILLMEHREQRVRPGLDDKILTSWNGLMLQGYADAYRAFQVEAYRDQAIRNANFIIDQMMDEDGRLNRNYKNGKSSINAFLDDYAHAIQGFTSLYEITFDEQWLEYADKLTKYTIEHFYNEENGMFYYTSNLDPALVARKMELSDNVIPASNSSMARNLYKLGTLMYNEDYVSKSSQMLHNMKTDLERGGTISYYSNWGQLYATMIDPVYEVAILGKESTEKAAQMQQNYLPNAYYLGGATEGSLELLKDKLQDDLTMIYVCQNKTCKLPVAEVNKALELIK